VRIIDRYLLRQFLQTFVICFVSLTGLYIVFDALSNLDSFLKCAEKQGNLMVLMGSYYSYRALFFFDRTAGMLALVSAMFTITWIQRHNELTALMAAGVPRIRVAAPVIAIGVAIALLATVNRELIIPQCRNVLARSTSDLVGNTARELQPRYDNETDILIRGRATYADDQRIDDPSFLLPLSLSRYGKQLTAKEAFYKLPQGDRPGGYLLVDVQQPNGLDKQPSLYVDGTAVIITARDAPDWLRPNECFVVSDVNFEQLSEGLAWRQFASTAQLIKGLRNSSLDFGADVRVTIHSRIVQPLLDVTLLFLGLPLVLSRESRNVFLAIGICVVVVAIFVLVTIGFQYLGSSLVLRSPALAAWAPLMIFVPVAVGMSESMWE
jgi:lipopolysaccharide export system permease protein